MVCHNYRTLVNVVEQHLDGSLSVIVHEDDDLVVDGIEEVVAVDERKGVPVFQLEVDS